MTSATPTFPPAARRPRVARWTLAGITCLLVAATVAALPMVVPMLRPAPPSDVGTVKTTAGGRYRVQLAPERAPVALSQMHRWTVRVDPVAPAAPGQQGATQAAPTATTVAVDGGMPQHGHGLPTQPRVTGRLPDGRLLIDGMKFSMPGWWELRLRIAGPAGVDSVTYNVTL